jgi:elongation factor G
MRVYETKRIRNVALVGHQDSGKTSLAEALLFNAGAITRLGKVENGNTASDWTEEEKACGNSLSTSLIPIEFNDYKINILDTPGLADFQAETQNAIRVADSVCVVVDAVSGVEVGTEVFWEYAKVYQQPIIVTINKLDRENASFQRTLKQLETAFPDYKFIPVMLPIGEQADFKGVVNLMTRRAYYNEGQERADVPDDMLEIVEAGHIELVEAAAEASETLIEKYFEDGDLSNNEIRDGMRMAARDHELRTVPVFVSSGTENIGTYPLMEAFTVYVSPPTQRRVGVYQPGSDEIEYINKPQSDDKPLAAYVFKSINDRYVGSLTFFRIFAGSIRSDHRYYNATRATDERFGQLMVIRGKEHANVDMLHTGDIGVVAKLSDTHTGDTLTDGDGYTIVKPNFPEPLYAVAVEPSTPADNSKMGPILSGLCDADPTLRWRHEPSTQEIILEGMGETHINLAVSLAERLGCNLNTAIPKVPYKETITATASDVYRHKKQSGGAGQFAEVHIRLEPNTGAGYVFESEIRGGAISAVFLPSIDKGIQSVLQEGVMAGYSIEDVKVIVYDGKEHPVDSKDIAFQIAGREAFKSIFMKAAPVLMEPIYNVEVIVPEGMMGDIISDMNTRRGRVQGMDTIGVKSVVNAQVPLAEMLRYGNVLRSMTHGRGLYSMRFSHYEQVPHHIAQTIVTASEAQPV